MASPRRRQGRTHTFALLSSLLLLAFGASTLFTPTPTPTLVAAIRLPPNHPYRNVDAYRHAWSTKTRMTRVLADEDAETGDSSSNARSARRLLQDSSEGDRPDTSSPAYAFTLQETTPSGASGRIYSYDISQFLPTSDMPFMPLLDPYVISNGVAAIDMTSLQYTSRDWSRWDGFDLLTDTFFKPSSFGGTVENPSSNIWTIGNTQPTLPFQTTTGTPITAATYQKLYNDQLAQKFFLTGYSWYRAYSYGTYDILVQFSKNFFSVTDVVQNTSYAINENYNIYRATTKAAMRDALASKLKPTEVDAAVDAQFDALTVDFASLPRSQATFDWLEVYFGRMLDIISIKHSMVSRGAPWGDYDTYGLVANAQSYGVGYDQFSHFFIAPSLGYMFGHYLKFVRTPVIRRIRTAMLASLSAQYAIWLLNGKVEQHSTCQWILRMTGFTTHTYVLLQSEKILRKRGDWQDAIDLVTCTDLTQGCWSNAYALQFSEQLMDEFVLRAQKYGFTEFLSTYYGMSMDILAYTWTHAPSQHCYDQFEKIWKMHNLDLALHYHPGSGTFSGPAGRSYDLYDGAHAKQDAYDIPQYFQRFFYPYCTQTIQRYRYDGTPVPEIVSACSALTPTTVDASADWTVPMNRIILATMQAAGYGYMPFDAFVNITLLAPYRSVYAIYSSQKGQERFDFITPEYTMGHAGEDSAAIPDCINIVARLSGKPNAGQFKAITNGGVTNSHGYVRLYAENNDKPYYRASAMGVGGIDNQVHARYLVTQYQSYMLTTSFLSGRTYFSTAEQQAPWNSNIALPISVDAIYGDNTLLPMTNNSFYALPPKTILTVRHGNASICVRVLRFDLSSGSSKIPHASSIFKLTNTANYQNGVGLQEYSMVWAVDTYSAQAGSGRVVIHHKHKSTTDAAPQHYRVATLWAAGVTRNDAEMHALQRLLRHATFTETITNSSGWNPANQPWAGNPTGRSIYSTDPEGSSTWSIRTKMTAGITLGIDREDVYQPYSWDPAWSQPMSSPLNVAPYYIKSNFKRTVNEKDMYEPFFDGANSNTPLNAQGSPFTYVKHDPKDVLQEHLTNPITCEPGVDFPCWQWLALTDWSACSATCGSGTQTRATACLDRSGGNAVAKDNTLCSLAPAVPTTQSCNLGPCANLPSAPSVTGVTSASKQATVSFKAPTSDGGAPITSFIVTSNPGGVTASGSASPITVSGLTNGQTYTFTVQAVNIAGPSAASSATAAIIIDSFSWTYTSYSACSQPCGGGTQSRSVACTGSVYGTVPAGTSGTYCPTAAPTDLSRTCNVQACTWSTGDWSACSKACSTGSRTRKVICTDGVDTNTAIDAAKCTAVAQPATQEACNTQKCVWVTGEWSTCSKSCGGGTQTRDVTCNNGLTLDVGANLPASTCAAAIGTAPPSSQACATDPCVTYQWKLGGWSTCDQLCSGGQQTRAITCVSSLGQTVDNALCTTNVGPAPASTQSCNTQACIWLQGGYRTECSQPCGGGVQTQVVACTDDKGTRVADARCSAAAQPASSRACNTQACAWLVGAYAGCPVTCGGGIQTRTAQCVDGTYSNKGAVVDDKYCAGLSAPVLSQVCATNPCPTVPGAPTAVTVVPGDGTIRVAFTPPTFTGYGTLSSYRVRVLPGGAVTSGKGSPIDVASKNGVPVTVQVAADNEVGFGNYSLPSPVVTAFGVPDGPVITLVKPGDRQLTVSWAGNDTSGGPAPSYEVATFPATKTFEKAVSPLTMSDLTNGQPYTVTIVAINPSGRSKSSTSATVTPATLPGAIKLTSVTAGDARAEIAFAPPTNGGSAITSYTVLTVGHPELVTTASPPSSSAFVTIHVLGLNNTRTYSFVVYATNGVGDGPRTSASTPVTPIGVPTAPRNIRVVIGNERAQVFFDVPTSDEGAPITSYAAYATPAYALSTPIASKFGISKLASPDGTNDTSTTSTAAPTPTPAQQAALTAAVSAGAPSSSSISASGSSSPLNITGLVNGVSYVFTVVAINAIGASRTAPQSPEYMPQDPNNPISSYDPSAALAGSSASSLSNVTPGHAGFYLVLFLCLGGGVLLCIAAAFAVRYFRSRRRQVNLQEIYDSTSPKALQAVAIIEPASKKELAVVSPYMASSPSPSPSPPIASPTGDFGVAMSPIGSPSAYIAESTVKDRASGASSAAASGAATPYTGSATPYTASGMATPHEPLGAHEQELADAHSATNAHRPQMIPEFAEMEYAPSFQPAEPGTNVLDSGSASPVPTDDALELQQVTGSNTNSTSSQPAMLPAGRVFHYGARGASRAGSRLASAAGSRAASKPGSKAGSVIGSRTTSRRVSPERGHIPAGAIAIEGSPQRRTSFVIGELPNVAAQRAAELATASASSKESNLSKKRGSTIFANLAGEQGVSKSYRESAAFSPEPPKASPPVLGGGALGAGTQMHFNAVSADTIRFAQHVHQATTTINDAEPTPSPSPSPSPTSPLMTGANAPASGAPRRAPPPIPPRIKSPQANPNASARPLLGSPGVHSPLASPSAVDDVTSPSSPPPPAFHEQ